MCVAVTYRGLGGTAHAKKLPKQLEQKLKFMGACFNELPALRKSRSRGLRLVARIALGHIREMQVGSLAAKTPIPYRAKDLEMLIEKILATVPEDIHSHFDESPSKVFYRAGARSVYFHDDYYSFHINPDGRLINFHPLGPHPVEVG